MELEGNEKRLEMRDLSRSLYITLIDRCKLFQKKNNYYSSKTVSNVLVTQHIGELVRALCARRPDDYIWL